MNTIQPFTAWWNQKSAPSYVSTHIKTMNAYYSSSLVDDNNFCRQSLREIRFEFSIGSIQRWFATMDGDTTPINLGEHTVRKEKVEFLVPLSCFLCPTQCLHEVQVIMNWLVLFHSVYPQFRETLQRKLSRLANKSAMHAAFKTIDDDDDDDESNIIIEVDIEVVTRVEQDFATAMELIEKEEKNDGCDSELPEVVVSPLNSMLVNFENKDELRMDLKDTCMICMDHFNVENRIISSLPCSHIYHRSCIIEWLTQTATCPICRFPLPS